MPPAGNANFAWVQHIIHHLAPTRHRRLRPRQRHHVVATSPAKATSARPSSRPTSSTAWSRCPASSSTSTQIPVCLWFLAQATRTNGRRFRDRRGETLFIDARKLGTLIDRVHRELTDDDIAKIAGTYHAWRGDKGGEAKLRQTSPASANPPTHRRDRRARPRPHARPLRRRRGGRGRRRTVRGKDAAPRRRTARPVRRVREAGEGHQSKPEGLGYGG